MKIINRQAICSRQINKESSAMFEVNKIDKSLLGENIQTGPFERKVVDFITKGEKKYVLCSNPIIRNN